MQATNSKLEEFLKGYIKNQELKNRKLTFENYKRGEGLNYDRTYNEAMTRLLTDMRRSTRDASVIGERLQSTGLAGGGYGEYVRSGLTTDVTDELRELEEAHRESDEKARLKYARYSTSYDENQEVVKSKLINRLIQGKVYEPMLAYALAVEAGATHDVAKDVSDTVVMHTRDKLKAELMEQLMHFEISTESAVKLAEMYGMNAADIEELKRLGPKYDGSDGFTLPPGSAEYLERLGELVNPTISFKDGYPQINI